MLPSDMTEDEIASRLREASRHRLLPNPAYQITFPPGWHDRPPRPAAVLVPFIHFHGEWNLLLTRRTDTLPEHSGQVAFPGGSSDPEDQSPEATALREAQEEIGLPPENVRLLGKLEPFQTNTNYLVTPVIGRVLEWPFPLKLEEVEVRRVFTIPLAWLADPSHRELRPRALPFSHTPLWIIYYQPYDGEILWGVSAQITLNLLRALRME